MASQKQVVADGRLRWLSSRNFSKGMIKTCGLIMQVMLFSMCIDGRLDVLKCRYPQCSGLSIQWSLYFTTLYFKIDRERESLFTFNV